MKKIALLLSLAFASGAYAAEQYPATLAGHAVLPAATFIDPPADAPDYFKISARYKNEKYNRVDEAESMDGFNGPRKTGIKKPFNGQPVQGHSGIKIMKDGTFWLISDNGFGNKLNSPDAMLFLNQYKVDFESGKFEPLKTVFFKDPNKVIPFHITQEATKERYLSGMDLDPESFQPIGEHFWVGEEFGPYLLELDADGTVLSIFETEVDGKKIISPDHYSINLPGKPDGKMPMYQSSRSKGFEGMAASPDQSKLYPLLEGALYDHDKKEYENTDGKNYLRILEFDTQAKKWTGKSWKYHLEDNGNAIGDFNMIDDTYGMIIERDNSEGSADKLCPQGQKGDNCFETSAKFKRIYKVKLDPNSDVAEKIGFIDLMAIEDPNKVARKPLVDGKFTFPFFTIEDVDVLDQDHIIVGNDNNLPGSASRDPNKADDNELIKLKVTEFLQAK